MPNTQYLGTDAGFYYYESGATTWRTFPLAVPLRDPQPSYNISYYAVDSLDKSRRQVFGIASTTTTGAMEYVATLRYNDDHTGLIDFLKHASLNSGSTTYPLRYTTDLTTGTTAGGVGTGADVWLIEPIPTPADVTMDPQRASFGDLAVTVRLRALSTAGFSTASGARWF